MWVCKLAWVCFPQVSIGQCTEGIIQVSEKTKTLNPRQQDTFVFEISASLNMDFQHNCTSEYIVATHNYKCYFSCCRSEPSTVHICTSWFAAVLTNSDGTVLDMKIVSFSTMEGCVYCPAGQCDCDVSSHT